MFHIGFLKALKINSVILILSIFDVMCIFAAHRTYELKKQLKKITNPVQPNKKI